MADRNGNWTINRYFYKKYDDCEYDTDRGQYERQMSEEAFDRADAAIAEIANAVGVGTALADLSDTSYLGLVVTATAGTAVAIGDACYIKSDGKFWKASASSATFMPAMALAVETISSDASGDFLTNGYIRIDSGFGGDLTVGGMIYVSAATDGFVTQTAPSTSGDQVQSIGIAYAARTIYFVPNLVVVEVP